MWRGPSVRAATTSAGAVLLASCVVSPADLCPADSCPSGLTVTVHRDKNAPFDVGGYGIRVESDVGNAALTCTFATDGASCDGDATAKALLAIGSVLSGNQLSAVYVTIRGTPTRATVTMTKGPATLGTQTFTSPSYSTLESCGGQKCKVASGVLAVP